MSSETQLAAYLVVRLPQISRKPLAIVWKLSTLGSKQRLGAVIATIDVDRALSFKS